MLLFRIMELLNVPAPGGRTSIPNFSIAGRWPPTRFEFSRRLLFRPLTDRRYSPRRRSNRSASPASSQNESRASLKPPAPV